MLYVCVCVCVCVCVGVSVRAGWVNHVCADCSGKGFTRKVLTNLTTWVTRESNSRTVHYAIKTRELVRCED